MYKRQEVDNWIGNYLLIVLGLLEVITLAWLVRDDGLVEMNKGGLWHVPKWFYKLFHQFLTPICIIAVSYTHLDVYKRQV